MNLVRFPHNIVYGFPHDIVYGFPHDIVYGFPHDIVYGFPMIQCTGSLMYSVRVVAQSKCVQKKI